MDESRATQDPIHRWPFIAAAISGLALIVVFRWVPHDQRFLLLSSVIVGVCGVVLVFTLPICVLTLLGHQPVMTLSPLVPSSHQRAKWRDMRQRPELSDKEFYFQFYGSTGIPEEIPLRLRGVYAGQLGISRVLPNDKATDFDEELDFCDLLFAVAEEFSIEFTEAEVKELATVGTFEAIVRCVASKPLINDGESCLQTIGTEIVDRALQHRRIGMLIGLLVVGVAMIGASAAVGRLDDVVPGAAMTLRIAGIALATLALCRGEYRSMVVRRLVLCIILIAADVSPVAMADEPSGKQASRTIEELFSAYRKATEERDWKALFKLGTREWQDSEILMLIVGAATSNDGTLKNLVEKHGGNWRQFDHAWTDADNQRFMRDCATIAASVGKEVKNKPEFFVAARSHIESSGESASSKVHELKNVVRHGATAVGEAIESRTCIERQYDAQGNRMGQVSRTFPVTARLWFRQIDGDWFLATQNEVDPSSAPRN